MFKIIISVLSLGGILGLNTRYYSPGTHGKYKSFLSRNLVTEKGKELELPEGRGGGKGEPDTQDCVDLYKTEKSI